MFSPVWAGNTESHVESKEGGVGGREERVKVRMNKEVEETEI